MPCPTTNAPWPSTSSSLRPRLFHFQFPPYPPLAGQPNDIQSDADVDSLFLPDEDGGASAARQRHSLITSLTKK
jgi:hypothetical protein